MNGGSPAVLVLAAAIAIGAIAPAGCAADRLRGRVAEVGRAIRQARESGAENCAPVELAIAVAHVQFAATELDEGNHDRARTELAIAQRNAEQALRQSPRERCAVAVEPDLDRDGVPDSRDECRRQPEDPDGTLDEDGCPETDNDGDGLADDIDRCPNTAEDRDGHDDEDGCADPDNDGDTLVDRIDQCPDRAEDPDGVDDDDGCPDCDDDGDQVPECPKAMDRCPGQPGRPGDGCPGGQRVRIGEERIDLARPLRFKGRSALLDAPSLAQLDDVASALVEQPGIRIRVHAHTDNRGRDRANLFLSRARAAAVKNYLTSRGIDGNRIVSEGYGETRPIADNRTVAGRARNQRVELVITGR